MSRARNGKVTPTPLAGPPTTVVPKPYFCLTMEITPLLKQALPTLMLSQVNQLTTTPVKVEGVLILLVAGEGFQILALPISRAILAPPTGEMGLLPFPVSLLITAPSRQDMQANQQPTALIRLVNRITAIPVKAGGMLTPPLLPEDPFIASPMNQGILPPPVGEMALTTLPAPVNQTSLAPPRQENLSINPQLPIPPHRDNPAANQQPIIPLPQVNQGLSTPLPRLTPPQLPVVA